MDTPNAPSAVCSAAVGRVSNARAWSAWVATTTASKRRTSSASSCTDTPAAWRSTGAHGSGELGGGELLGRALDVGAGTAHHRAPVRRTLHLQRAVVLEEGEQRPRRVRERGRRGARPHARHERHHEVTDEVVGVAPGAQELAQGHEPAVGRVGRRQEPPRGTVETLHLHQHAQKAPIHHIAGLGEHTTESARPRVLEPTPLAPHRHAHVGGLRLHLQLGEEPEQIRVGAVVVHDEPGVDRDHAVVGREHVVGVRVAPETVLGLVERHVALPLQQVRGSEARHSRADHRDTPTFHDHDPPGRQFVQPAANATVRAVSRPSPTTSAATNSVARRCQNPARRIIPCPLRPTRTHATSRATVRARAREARRGLGARRAVAGAVEHGQ